MGESTNAYDVEGWIDSAEQSDDTLKGIWCALIAIAKSQERIAALLENAIYDRGDGERYFRVEGRP